jgi:hypothetical protein
LVGPTQLDNMVMKFNLFLKDFNDYPLRIKWNLGTLWHWGVGGEEMRREILEWNHRENGNEGAQTWMHKWNA